MLHHPDLKLTQSVVFPFKSNDNVTFPVSRLQNLKPFCIPLFLPTHIWIILKVHISPQLWYLTLCQMDLCQQLFNWCFRFHPILHTHSKNYSYKMQIIVHLCSKFPSGFLFPSGQRLNPHGWILSIFKPSLTLSPSSLPESFYHSNTDSADSSSM